MAARKRTKDPSKALHEQGGPIPRAVFEVLAELVADDPLHIGMHPGPVNQQILSATRGEWFACCDAVAPARRSVFAVEQHRLTLVHRALRRGLSPAVLTSTLRRLRNLRGWGWDLAAAVLPYGAPDIRVRLYSAAGLFPDEAAAIETNGFTADDAECLMALSALRGTDYCWP